MHKSICKSEFDCYLMYVLYVYVLYMCVYVFGVVVGYILRDIELVNISIGDSYDC